MKKIIPILIIAICVSSCTKPKPTESPFVLPAGVTYETEGDIEFHAFHWGSNATAAVFMIYPHPAGLNYAMVDKMASDSIPTLEAAMREVEGVDNLNTETHDFKAGDFTGKVINCTVNMADGKKVYQAMHILWDGTRLWQGQLTGTTENDLEMGERILNSKTK
ncbi:MAG: hypothetical protein PHI93_07930 [Kiritimatiellae bacterium]|nr:hypothetical protein [Kiritimatiellia bacterium]